jgi:hypothetical protein
MKSETISYKLNADPAALEFQLASRDVICLEPSQLEKLATILSSDFYTGAAFRYLIPDDHARFRILKAFFSDVLHASQLHGEIHTTQNIDGAALWIHPGSSWTHGEMMRTASNWTSNPSIQLNVADWLNLTECLDAVHQRVAGKLHWHLLAFGVDLMCDRNKIGETLLEPTLLRADSQALACYLETFNERDLPFYKTYGFRIAGSGQIPGGGPDVWAMIRAPHGYSAN